MTPQFLRDTGLNFGRWVRVPGGVDVPRSDRVSRCALEWECAWEALSPVEAPVDGRAAFTATSADAVGSAAPLTWVTMETRVQGLRDRGANPERDPVGLIVLFIQAPGRPPRAVALMLATDFASAPAARALCTQHGFVEVGGVSPPPAVRVVPTPCRLGQLRPCPTEQLLLESFAQVVCDEVDADVIAGFNHCR